MLCKDFRYSYEKAHVWIRIRHAHHLMNKGKNDIKKPGNYPGFFY